NAIFAKIINAKLSVIHDFGAGIDGSENVYDLADTKKEQEIQDFMFANQDHITSSEILENQRAEAEDVIYHFKQHPSLILWTGGFKNDLNTNDNHKKVLEGNVNNHDSFHPYLDYISTGNWKSN